MSRPLNPMEQYERWQLLERRSEAMEKAFKKLLQLEITLLPRLKGADEKKLRAVLWLAHDALKVE